MEDVHGTTMALTVFPARIRAIEAEAAARAVDEALSVERVAEALHVTAPKNHPPRPMLRSICMGYFPHTEQAAALVAHLRGPRP